MLLLCWVQIDFSLFLIFSDYLANINFLSWLDERSTKLLNLFHGIGCHQSVCTADDSASAVFFQLAFERLVTDQMRFHVRCPFRRVQQHSSETDETSRGS